MDKLLTTDQRDGLIRELDNWIENNELDPDDVRTVIDLYTEKLFPEFELRNAEGDILLNLKSSELNDKFNAINFDFFGQPDGAASRLISPNEFRQFAEGVATIRQWLDKNNE